MTPVIFTAMPSACKTCWKLPWPRESLAPGDLCFFRGETTERITHVAFYAGEDTIVHSTVACGEVVRERWEDGSRASALRRRFVSARRVG